MELIGRHIHGVTVLDVRGKLIGEPVNCDKFHELFKALLDEGDKNFVVDLDDSEWADSRGLGMLIGAYTSARRAGGDLVLTRVTERTASILKVTRLDLIFKKFSCVDEAVKYLLAGESAIKPNESSPTASNYRSA
jgi:anti-anti-sigma factor